MGSLLSTADSETDLSSLSPSPSPSSQPGDSVVVHLNLFPETSGDTLDESQEFYQYYLTMKAYQVLKRLIYDLNFNELETETSRYQKVFEGLSQIESLLKEYQGIFRRIPKESSTQEIHRMIRQFDTKLLGILTDSS